MIEKLASNICSGPAVVVLDACIPTEENLALIEARSKEKYPSVHHYYNIEASSDILYNLASSR